MRDLTRIPICLIPQIGDIRDPLPVAPPPPRQQQPLPRGLSLRTFNIRNVRGYRLAQAIRAVQIGSFNIIILKEAKITNQAYCSNRLGYDVL